MKYNKHKQAYEIIGRFRITEANGTTEYCRVKFLFSKKEQVVRADLIKTGDFEDVSLLKKSFVIQGIDFSESYKKRLSDSVKDIPPIIISEPPSVVIPESFETESALTVNPESIPLKFSNTEVGEIGTAGDIDFKTSPVIAVNPKGDEIEVWDIEQFCTDNKLDLEAVQSVLEGKQKTHRKWRFKTA